MAQEEQIDVHMICLAFCSPWMKNGNRKRSRNWSLTTFERFNFFLLPKLFEHWTYKIMLISLFFFHYETNKSSCFFFFWIILLWITFEAEGIFYSCFDVSVAELGFFIYSFCVTRWDHNSFEIWDWIVSFDMQTLVNFRHLTVMAWSMWKPVLPSINNM